MAIVFVRQLSTVAVNAVVGGVRHTVAAAAACAEVRAVAMIPAS